MNSSSALCVNELRVGGPHEVDAEDRLLHREPKLRTIRKVIRGRRHLATALRARTTAGECVALLLKSVTKHYLELIEARGSIAYAMLLLCCAMLRHAMLCYAVLCYAVRCDAMLRYTTLRYAMLCHAT